MLKKYGDIISGVVLLLLSIALFAGSFGVQRLTISRIGSGFVPQVVAVILAVVSIGVIRLGIKSLRNYREDNNGSKNEQANLRGFIATLVLLAAYVFTLTPVGFLITTAVYMFIQMMILATKEQRKIPLMLVISVFTSTAVYFVFLKVFHLVLPVGILG